MRYVSLRQAWTIAIWATISTRKALRDPNSKPELDRRLDQALKETFPASDLMAIMIC